jgi:hypothetical protein
VHCIAGNELEPGRAASMGLGGQAKRRGSTGFAKVTQYFSKSTVIYMYIYIYLLLKGMRYVYVYIYIFI